MLIFRRGGTLWPPPFDSRAPPLTFPQGNFALESLPTVRANVRLIEGVFEDRLSGFLLEHPDVVAFINIDSDLYSAAKTILTKLNAQIVPGTILYFDTGYLLSRLRR